MEISFIASYNSYYDGYNSTLGGDCNPSNNPDVVKKRTEKILNSPETLKKLSHKGEANPRAKLTDNQVY